MADSALTALHQHEEMQKWNKSRFLTIQPEDSELYDEVTDDQYRSIVGSRLDQDDFIIDDDGSGYVDNGMDDWDNAEDNEESEDEDDFEGEDEELRLGELNPYPSCSDSS